MRILITGANGFVGRHLSALATSEGHDVIPVDRGDADVTDANAMASLVRDAAPDAVCHLAAQSSVAASFREPMETFRVNVLGTVSILEAVRQHAQTARVLVASSADVYAPASNIELPLTEESPVRPLSPYAASKVSQEQVALQYALAYGLSVVITRSFNAIGPGQSVQFALPSFAAQLAAIARNEAEPVLRVGNLDIERDFVDVRDVAQAQLGLVTSECVEGIYQVCSGKSYSIRSLLEMLVRASCLDVSVETDPQRLRPVEVLRIIGSFAKLASATSWEPCVCINQTLRDLFAEATSLAIGGDLHL